MDQIFWGLTGSQWMEIGISLLILLGVLLVAWKWEKAGGVTLIILGLVLSVLVFRMNYRMNNSIILFENTISEGEYGV